MENNAEIKINGDKNIVYILQNNNGGFYYLTIIFSILTIAVFFIFGFIIMAVTQINKSPQTYKPWLKIENQIIAQHNNNHNQIKEANWCQHCKNEISLYFKDHKVNKNRNDIHKFSLCPICKHNSKLDQQDINRLNKIANKKTKYIAVFFDKYPMID